MKYLVLRLYHYCEANPQHPLSPSRGRSRKRIPHAGGIRVSLVQVECINQHP